jgi:hypothetical protein
MDMQWCKEDNRGRGYDTVASLGGKSFGETSTQLNESRL